MQVQEEQFKTAFPLQENQYFLENDKKHNIFISSFSIEHGRMTM
jgi:hypothetical protein